MFFFVVSELSVS